MGWKRRDLDEKKKAKVNKPRGILIPPNKRHSTVKDYDRKKEKTIDTDRDY